MLVARQSISAGLNAGSSVGAWIAAVLRDGIDPMAVRRAGERLRADMVRLKTTRAMGSMGMAVLWIIGAMVFEIATIFVPIPFGVFGSLAVFAAWITLMIAALFEPMTAEGWGRGVWGQVGRNPLVVGARVDFHDLDDIYTFCKTSQ